MGNENKQSLKGTPESLVFNFSPKAHFQIKTSLSTKCRHLSNPAMSKKNLLRELLPRNNEFGYQHPKLDLPTKQRRNVSLACTECQKKRSKVKTIVPPFDDRGQS